MNQIKEAFYEVVDSVFAEMFRYHGGVSTKGAAEIMNVSEETIRNWVKQGKLKQYGGTNFRFKIPDLIKLARNVL